MIDFHTHSNASDGTSSPSEIIELAEKIKLNAVALTDHDTVSGIPEFLCKAEASSVIGISGVEIAVNWNYKELHFLGLWIDHNNIQLKILLSEIRNNRDQRNNKIVEKLNNIGYQITNDELKEAAQGESVGRPHIASVLVNKGYFKKNKDVFSDCLARGGKGYVPRILPDPMTALSVIHNAGGIAIWAHPVHRNHSKTKDLFSNIKYFKSIGLDGIEAYYSEFSAAQHNMLLKYAQDLDMVISGGSDYHGMNHPDISLAIGRGSLSIPDSVYFDLLEYHEAVSC